MISCYFLVLILVCIKDRIHVPGELLTFNSWEYKPPAAKDIPQDFRVTLLKNVRNPTGMLSSKSKINEMEEEKLLEVVFCSHW